MRPNGSIRAVIAALALTLAASPAAAAPKADDDAKVAARALARKGYELYDAESYEQAIKSLQDAEQLYHAPTLVFMLAKAHAKLGKLIEARALFQKVADEKLAPSASADFRKAQASARQELASLKPQIPTLRLTITGAAGRALAVKLDGRLLPAAELDHPLEQNPGSHALSVTPAGGPELTRALTLKPGEQSDVVIQLPPALPVRVAGPVPAPAPSSGEWRSRVPAYVAFGAGAVGLGVGVGLGVVTLSKASEIKAHCNAQGLCPASERSRASAANTLAAGSTVGFVVAGVGAALGVTFLVLRPTPKAKARAGIVVGPLSLGAEGVF